MNTRKGFTLVEILVVIVIIAALFAIAVPSIMGISKKMKERGFEAKIESIEQAAVNFVQDNANKIKDKYGKGYIKDGKYTFKISVKDLINYDAYKSEKNDSNTTCDVTNPMDKNSCLDCREIEITLDDEYKTATAKVLRPEGDRYLIASTNPECSADFSFEKEYVNLTVDSTNRSWFGYSEAATENNVTITSTIEHDGIWYKVTSIGDYAFDRCSNLKSITIPDSVTRIGHEAFNGCNRLTSIKIPDSVTFIGTNAFIYCYDLTSVTIGNGVTWVGMQAFWKCTSLTSVTIGNSVTNIGSCAFFYCESLTSITIPDSVTLIGSRAFFGCESLISINVDNNNPSYKSIEGVLFTKDEKTLINYPPKKTNTNYTILDSVRNIENYAFYECKGLTSVTIGNGVTSIRDYAFYDCSSLTSVTIGNNVTSIGLAAFSGCRSLTSVNIPDSVTSIKARAFEICGRLTSIIIPDSVTSIGNSAFASCGLTSITIPDSVTSIGNWAFACLSLTSINVDENNNTYKSIEGVLFTKDGKTLIEYPASKSGDFYVISDGVTSIGDSAFSSCRNLTSVTIPNSVISIEYEAFSGCGRLTSITIPDSVTSIGKEAFYECYSLTSITYKGTAYTSKSAFIAAFTSTRGNTVGSYALANTRLSA